MRLLELRKKRKLTQKEVSDDLNINVVTYSGYENQKREANYSMLVKLSDYFNVSIDYLLDHKTNNLNLDDLSLIERDVIKNFLNLNNLEQNQVYGFIKALKKDKV